jgi:hypothetical protein
VTWLKKPAGAAAATAPVPAATHAAAKDSAAATVAANEAFAAQFAYGGFGMGTIKLKTLPGVTVEQPKITPSGAPSAGNAGGRPQYGPGSNERMIEVVLNDRLGKKLRLKVYPSDTILAVKKLASAKTGIKPEKMRLQKSSNVYKDHIRLMDYDVPDGMGFELYYG